MYTITEREKNIKTEREKKERREKIILSLIG